MKLFEENSTYLTLRGNFALWNEQPNLCYENAKLIGRLVKGDVFLVVEIMKLSYKILTKHGVVWILHESIPFETLSNQFQRLG